MHHVTVVDASDLAVTIITGHRPELLEQTLTSLLASTPGLLETAFVAILHNGADTPTADVLERFDHLRIFDHITTSSATMHIGQAAAAMLGTSPPRPYVLHLEDDWTCDGAPDGWYPSARQMLDDYPGVGQVRLRVNTEPVRRNHAITREWITWEEGPPGYYVATGAHYTLNPSLMRSADTPTVWVNPDSETGAQMRYDATGWETLQQIPGVFRHIGGGRSLRRGQVPR